MKAKIVRKGSRGSGNYGHAGRPGERGGSAKRGGYVPVSDKTPRDLVSVILARGVESGLIKVNMSDVHKGLKEFIKKELPVGKLLESFTRSGSTMYGIHLIFTPDVTADIVKDVVVDYIHAATQGWAVSRITENDITPKYDSCTIVYIQPESKAPSEPVIVKLE